MNRRGPSEGYISPFVPFPPSFARTFPSREREMSWYEAELPLYNITAIWKSHESVTSTLRSRRLMAWGQLSKQFVPRHHSTQTCTMTLQLQEPLTYDQHRNDRKQQYQNISLESLTNSRGSWMYVAGVTYATTRDPRPATRVHLTNSQLLTQLKI